MCIAAFGGLAKAQYLDPSDTAIAIDVNAVFGLNGRYPGAEGPGNIVDGTNAKYLNFGREGSGFIVTPGLSFPVDGFQITTANDAPSRDPASYELYGFNGALTTMDSGADPAINADGLAEAWSLISSGPLSLPGDPAIGDSERNVLGPMVTVGSLDTFDHYKMIFPTVKNPPGANSMQINEVQFFVDHTDTGTGFLQSTDGVIAVDGLMAWTGSGYPGAESPPNVLDGDSGTKYLNTGNDGSGMIITNSDGPVQVNWMQLTTANDAPGRDPTSYELYGTNDAIQSQDNTDGLGGEAWTLISAGDVSLPDERFNDSTWVKIGAGAAYSSYKLIFPTLKDVPGALMQIADVQFHETPEPSTLALLLVMGLAALGVTRRRND